jgi:hypothetical protein
MVTYEWNFPAFDCRLDEQLDRVVTAVHWVYTGVDEDGVTGFMYGSQAVGEPNPDAFTPYPQISKDQVIGWIEPVMDIETMQENITDQINLTKHPVITTLPAPWQTEL